GGDSRQEHKTARLLPLAGAHLRPLVQGDLPAMPQRFDHTGPRLAGPSRAILGARLDEHLHAVIGALSRPYFGRGSLSIRQTGILPCRAASRTVAASVVEDACSSRTRRFCW